jgi:plastocyanin
MQRTATLTILAVAAAAAAGASAHATAGGGGSAAATTLKLKADADGANRFDKKRLTAAPGRVTIRLRNPGSAGKPHAVEIEGKGVEKESDVAQPGDRVSVSARLKRGRYEFYCPVDGHEADGMRGTLVVK